jgi:hypothetical protein
MNVQDQFRIQQPAEDNDVAQVLEKLVKQAFARLACARHNNGLYAELQQLVLDAYLQGRSSMQFPLFKLEQVQQS